MNNSISVEIGNEMAVGKNNGTTAAVENDKNKDSLAKLTPGQIVTGTVVSVEEQVTLDFGGQKVIASKEVLQNVIPGEKKAFEVVRAYGSEVELRLLTGNVKELRKIVKGLKVKETDWETVLTQKEQKLKKAEKKNNTRESILKLEEIGLRFTEQDYKALEAEGFPVETMSIGGLYEAINRIKSDRQYPSQKDAVVRRETTAKKIGETELTVRLREENLPVTKQNLDRISKALTLSDTVSCIDEKAMKYLIRKDVEPTLENIYKAYYSQNSKHTEKVEELTDQEWTELKDQVKAVIQDAGYEVTQEKLADARWLLENKLPLTVRTFTYKVQLGEIKQNTDPNRILDRILDGMKSGTAPEDVSLANESIPAIHQILSDINSIGNEAVNYAVRERLELNIKKLAQVQEGIAKGKIPAEDTGKLIEEQVIEREILPAKEMDAPLTLENPPTEENPLTRDEYEQTKARRQLEEIRLKMTVEAAGRLVKKGISIETEKLEKVVEELRKLEDSYYKRLLSEAEAEGTPSAIDTLKTTTQSMEQLRKLPSSVLGATLTQNVEQTIPELITSGARLQADYAKAGIAYETLATVPDARYGDSIKKAFTNMDSLLEELSIENTEANKRAVRILGYNQMEITTENLDRVKAFDQEVTSLIQNLHPAVTVRMIKEGLNPLNMPIDELNQTIDHMKEEQGITSEDRFSTYLYKLEKDNQITPEDRKAYIGVYRLLYQVEKSDGAALGSVIKADQEVTLSHLLTALQTGRKGRISAVINDEFGLVAELKRGTESISEQLKSFTDSTTEAIAEAKEKETQIEQQTKYLNRILKQLTEEISPQKLQSLSQDMLQSGTTPNLMDTVLSQSAGMGTENAGLWETIKNIPVEKLLEQLKNTEETENTTGELYAGKVAQLRELGKGSEQSLRFLNDYQMTGSPQNIMIANHILSNGLSPIVRLLKRQNENNDENSENVLKEINEVSDTLFDKSSMNEAYESLEAQAKETLTRACSEETLDRNKLTELRSIGQQITFLRQLASREFYQIPVETDKGITNMNLTILHGGQISGRVSVTAWSEELGDIKAEFSLKDHNLVGFIACDRRDGVEKLQAQSAVIDKAVKEYNINLKQLDFGITGKEKDNYGYPNPQTTGQGITTGKETERSLYRLAKAMVQMVRLAENTADNAET